MTPAACLASMRPGCVFAYVRIHNSLEEATEREQFGKQCQAVFVVKVRARAANVRASRGGAWLHVSALRPPPPRRPAGGHGARDGRGPVALARSLLTRIELAAPRPIASTSVPIGFASPPDSSPAALAGETVNSS